VLSAGSTDIVIVAPSSGGWGSWNSQSCRQGFDDTSRNPQNGYTAMPGRKAKPPRLWFREDDETWIILHCGRQIRTGCGRDDVEGAAKALESYLGTQHQTTIGATDPRFLAIADVITFYEQLKRPKGANPRAQAQHELLLIRLEDLNAFFGAR